MHKLIIEKGMWSFWGSAWFSIHVLLQAEYAVPWCVDKIAQNEIPSNTVILHFKYKLVCSHWPFFKLTKMPTASVEATTTFLVFSMLLELKDRLFLCGIFCSLIHRRLEITATVKPLTMKKKLECDQNLC